MIDYEKLYPVGGALKSPEDKRDYKIQDVVMRAVQLPDKFTVNIPAIIADQREVGSCVACSLAQIKHCQEYQETGDYKMFSAAYIYGNRREDDYCGSGMLPREALTNLVLNGTCYEDDFPGYNKYEYNECHEKYLERKTELDRLSKPFRAASYYRLDDINDIKTALYTTNQYVQICYKVYKCLYVPDKDGFVHYNRILRGKNYGGHSMVVCGYDDTKQALGIINSWGLDFGVGINGVSEGGCIWIPYDYPFMESWCCIDAKTQKEMVEFFAKGGKGYEL